MHSKKVLHNLGMTNMHNLSASQGSPTHNLAGHNLTGIASQFAMHLGFTCDVISVTHRSD